MMNGIVSGLNRLAYVGIALVVAMTVASSAQAQSAVVPPGAGTEANPYQISQLGHLVWMGDNIGSSSGKYYTMQNNIDASATAGWNGGAGFAPIGSNNAASFKGIFNGNGQVISGLTINRPGQDRVGLFGQVGTGGMVKDLGLAGGTVTGNNNVGGLVGFNEGTASGCHVTGTVAGNYTVGGLAGWSGGTVNGCYATGAVTGDSTVGGLVGDNYSYGTVSGCYATGPVTGDSTVGGLVGINYSHGTVSGCHATGSVAGDTFEAGGLVGDNYYGTVSGCYATGPVTGNSDVGGLVGYNFGGTVSGGYATGPVNGNKNVGGLAGWNGGPVNGCYATGPVTGITNSIGGLVGYNFSGATVSKCYAAGLVSGGTDVGGLVGSNNANDTVGYSYWDTQTSGQAASAGGTGKTTAQMKQQTTFATWDFASVWGISESVSYPFLQWQGPFAGATDLGGGWKWLSWFGYFHDAGNGWIYHQQHHWMYTVGTTPASIWLWTQDLGWLWTKSTTYPYLYRNTGPAWLWYQVGTSGPRWFNNLTTGHWESH